MSERCNGVFSGTHPRERLDMKSFIFDPLKKGLRKTLKEYEEILGEVRTEYADIYRFEEMLEKGEQNQSSIHV